MEHSLKIWPQYYCRVADGSKTFEVRNNDRGFQPGDIVILNWYDPEDDFYSRESKPLKFKVGYVLPIENNKVVFSLLPLTNAPAQEVKDE